MFLIDMNSHYYMYFRKPPTSILKTTYLDVYNFYLAIETSSTLNFVSERDPDQIVQTHMLS